MAKYVRILGGMAVTLLILVFSGALEMTAIALSYWIDAFAVCVDIAMTVS